MSFSIVHSSIAPPMDQSSVDYSSDSSVWEPFETEDISWISIVMGIIIIVTVTGNLFTIMAYAQSPKIKRSVSNLFILNLSIAGCVVGAVILPINTSWVLLGYWPYGQIFCQIWIVIDYTTAYMSVLMITLISLDRFWLVTKKLKYQDFQTRRQVKIMITACWVFSFLFYATVTFAWAPIVGESVIDYSEDCEMESLYNTPFNTAVMFLEFIIPLMVISILNSIVYANIKRRSMGMVKPPSNPKPASKPTPVNPESSCENGGTRSLDSGREVNVSTVSISVSSEIKNGVAASGKPAAKGLKVKEDKKKEFNRHRKAAITLAVIVGVFLCCWLPYYITTIWTAICEECVSNRIWELANNLLWCNSTLNPFLYAFTNIHYRRKFTQFLGIQQFLKRHLASPDTESSAM